MFAVGADGEQEIELLGEDVVVVGGGDPEEGEGFEEGAASGDDLGASVAEVVQGGEVLVQANRVEGGQNGYGAGEADAGGGLGDGCERDGGVGHGEVGAVVFAEAEDVQARLVGGDGVGDDLAGAPGGVVGVAGGGVGLHVGQGQDADFHGVLLETGPGPGRCRPVCPGGWGQLLMAGMARR
ncbi:hypothetical protein GCM10010244_55520 [Streptomyces coeruleorubidus]|nr:hypothetical protein GCM10010244_55520 [Streptomyces bellus]